MNTSAVIMMVIGLVTLLGGFCISIYIEFSAAKKNK